MFEVILNYDDEYEERPRHKKKTMAKKEKSRKADHRHAYEDCIARYQAEDAYGKIHTLLSPARYCTVCGKLDCNWFRTLDGLEGGKLPVFNVEMWDKELGHVKS